MITSSKWKLLCLFDEEIAHSLTSVFFLYFALLASYWNGLSEGGELTLLWGCSTCEDILCRHLENLTSSCIVSFHEFRRHGALPSTLHKSVTSECEIRIVTYSQSSTVHLARKIYIIPIMMPGFQITSHCAIAPSLPVLLSMSDWVKDLYFAL